MTRKKLSTEVRRRQIAEAALSIIQEQGVGGLSISGIASRVGMAPSNLYRHFSGKEEVLVTAIDYLAGRMAGNVSRSQAETRSPLARLHGVLTRHAGMLETFAGLPLLLFSEEVFHGGGELRERLLAAVHGYVEALTGLVEQGQARGEMRADLEPRVIAVMALGVLIPAAALWLMTGKSFDLHEQIEASWSVFRRGMEPEEEEEEEA